MRIKLKSLIATLLILIMIALPLSGCSSGDGNSKHGETMVIRIGTHAQSEDDPYWVDEITGTSSMNADRKKAAEHALETVKEELGIEIQFVQYSSDLQQLLLQTVLAGDPYCELAILWGGCQGNILSQNILQPLDDYAYIFHDDPDGAWILPQKTFGHYYLMNRDLLYTNTWPIVYNISMLEEVPALREADGTTLYPAEMYYNGTWTWSNFKDYVTKVKTYYSGKKSASGADIASFNTNFTFFGLFALHSVGAGVYDGDAMSFDSEDAVKAIEFVDDLFTTELVTCSNSQKGVKADAGWLNATEAFLRGETVFTNAARWRMDDCSMSLATRGESMGVIPFPYPDGTNPHTDADSKYRHLTPMADSVGLLRGIDEETSTRALEAYKMYKVEFYKAYAQVDSIATYMEEHAGADALTFGVDIFHPEIGDLNLEIWKEFGSEPANEYSEACAVQDTWGGIFGRSIYGVNGSPKYRTAVEANKQSIFKKLDDIGAAVNSAGAIDSVKPSVGTKQVIAIEAGTNPEDVLWGDYITVNDNADGEISVGVMRLKSADNGFGSSYAFVGATQALMSIFEQTTQVDGYNAVKWSNFFTNPQVSFDWSNIDFDTVGAYKNEEGEGDSAIDRRLKVDAKDNSGNSGSGSFDVLIYDPENKEPPTLEPKIGDEPPSVALNADVSTTKWGDYVEWAKDADGLDISSNISADTGWLDVTVEGEYPVGLVATDYAGNSVEVEITVAVKKK